MTTQFSGLPCCFFTSCHTACERWGEGPFAGSQVMGKSAGFNSWVFSGRSVASAKRLCLSSPRNSDSSGTVVVSALLYIYFCLCHFLGPHPQHMEVPRLGVKSELYPPAYTRATATQDPSQVCSLHNSSWQYQILNPLIEARDRTRNLMVPSRIR